MEDKLINIEEMIRLFKKKFWIIIVITIITIGLGYYKSSQMVTRYQATAKIFIGKGDNLLNINTPQEIQYYSRFMNDFKEIIKVDDFLNKTLSKHNIEATAGEVKGGLGFTSAENSTIFSITYSGYQKDKVAPVVNAICLELSDQVEELMPGTTVKILDSAKVFPIMPNKKRVIMLGFIIGIILSIGIILVIDYLDDTVKSKDRLEKLLQIPVLGTLPKFEKGFKE